MNADPREKSTISFTILGDPPIKKNSNEVVHPNGSGFAIIPNKKYREYEQLAAWQIPGRYRLRINYPVTVKAIFYRQTRRRVDKSNLEEALHDILVKYGVLADDCRDVIASSDGSRVYYDKANPRVEVTISPLDDPGYTVWSKGK